MFTLYTVFPPFCVLLSPTSSRSSVHRQVSVLSRSVLMAILLPLSLYGDKALADPRHRTYDLKKRTQPASHLASSKLHASYHPAAAVTDVFSYFRYVSNISSYNITLCYTVLLQKCNKSAQKPNGRLMLVMSDSGFSWFSSVHPG